MEETCQTLERIDHVGLSGETHRLTPLVWHGVHSTGPPMCVVCVGKQEGVRICLVHIRTSGY